MWGNFIFSSYDWKKRLLPLLLFLPLMENRNGKTFLCSLILNSITPRDFSFINEENLTDIFAMFARFRIPINLMQNSAISFSVCVDGDKAGFEPLREMLQVKYKVKFNSNPELVTIRTTIKTAWIRLSGNASCCLSNAAGQPFSWW